MVKKKGEPLERRSDDNVDALKKRLENYHSQTAPLAQYYATKGLHKEIDASLPSDVVHQNVVSIIENMKKAVYIQFFLKSYLKIKLYFSSQFP